MAQPIVIVETIAANHNQLEIQFIDAIDRIKLREDFDKATAVFIKPNLTYSSYREGVTTRLEFIEGLVAALRSINATTKIYIGEGEGGYNSFSMSDGMRKMGYYGLESKYPNVCVVNLSKLPRHRIELNAKNRSYFVDLPAIFFDEIDFSITCPLPKVHCMTKITLAFKNQWGCLPDTMRLHNHYVFNEIISQVCNVLKFRYAFLDGKYGLDNYGPMTGDPVEVNWFVASNSLGAFDVVVSEMMGFDWWKVSHLVAADRHGFIPKRENIQTIGDVSAFKRRFALHRGFWSYPALIAFQSKTLTHFFYSSRWAKLLHDIMYTVRKKPFSE